MCACAHVHMRMCMCACAHMHVQLHVHLYVVGMTAYVNVQVYVQRIVRLVREDGDEAMTIKRLLSTRSMLHWYITKNFEGEERMMLLQAHEMCALVVLVDGVDEAAGMKEAIEEFVHKEASVSGSRLVVTSRPEGVSRG